MKPDINLIEKGYCKPPKDVKITLGYDDKCYFVKRLRFAVDIPIAIEEQYYPLEIRNELENHALNNAAIYDIFEKSLGINLWEAQEVITSRMASTNEAELLQLDQAPCVLYSKQFLTDIDGNFVEYEINVSRSDMYAFQINSKRQLGT